MSHDGNTSNFVASRPWIIKPGRANVRTTFQLAAQVLPRHNQSVDDAVTESRRVILDWLRSKFPEPIPAEAYHGDSFFCEEHGQKIACTPVADEGIWTARLEQPDAPFRDRPAVPGRFWTVDLALRRQEEFLCFGVRVQCASLEYARNPVALTRPGIVLALTGRFTLREARDLDGAPWRLTTFDDLRAFESLLLDPTRNMPVVLLTQPDRSRLHMGVSEFLLDPVWLAHKLLGFGYVATMPRELGFHWTDMVGKPWSAFLGAVRTYMPGLDYEQDTPMLHPLTFAEKILFWRYEDEDGQHERERAFERFVADRIREHAATKRMDWRGCVFVPEARSLRAARARKSSADAQESLDLYEIEIEALSEELQEAREEASTAFAVAEQIEKERDFFREENAKLRSRIAWLEHAFQTQTASAEMQEEPAPLEYGDIADWVERRFASRLVLHSRALKGLKNAVYENVSLVCDTLVLLATVYRDMRLGHAGAKEQWESGLQSLNLEFAGAITETRAGEEGDTYYLLYPPHSNERCLLEFHVRKGNSRDQRHCLRVYYFWHAPTQQVVVGWLPSHLNTRNS